MICFPSALAVNVNMRWAKTSGKANIRKNLEDLGLELDEDAMRKVTERIIELGDKKELVTQEDLPYIVLNVLKHGS